MDSDRSKRLKNPRRAAAQIVESLGAAGVTHVGKRKARPAAAAKPASAPASAAAPQSAALPGLSSGARRESPAGKAVAAAVPPVASAPATAPQRLAAAGQEPWSRLQCEVAACRLCHELASTRKQTVFGVGSLHPRLCFLGEAPGADEDQQGEPFVGAAGKLLTKIIEACNLTRQDVYILNVLKCRPPGNRTPAPDEVANCRSFLERQLAMLQPEFICCLGAVAAQNLLETTTPIGRLRGRLHQHNGRQVLCTYHPAYLLRNPAAKRDVWEDMKLLMSEMGTPVE